MKTTPNQSTPLLEVRNLKTKFLTEEGSFFAADNVSFRLEEGRTLGIVGESGCGKSVTSLSIMRLIQKPGSIESGEIFFKGRNLLKLSEQEFRNIRGNEIAMIFQEPMTSLNPVFTIGNQIDEVIFLHQPDLSSSQVRLKTIETLRKVGIPAPEERYDDYPHQLSGGMRQRVMIAMAMSCLPKILIADEPTTALDVTIQAQILDLMRKLQKDFNSAMILITHDLGVVAEMCQNVLVMYAGQVIESGPVDDIFYRPQHPYTRGLLDSIPHFESTHKLKTLKTIPGSVPNLAKLPPGCRFADRCNLAKDKCRQEAPLLTSQSGDNREVACFFPLTENNNSDMRPLT
jgi:peptide/nickel transport system ATP-binding protein